MSETPETPPVNYVQDTGIVRVVIDGVAKDVPVSDLKAGFQMRSAAEKRLMEANALKSSYSQDIALAQQARVYEQNPQMAAAEYARRAGLKLAEAQPENADDGSDSVTKQMRAELQAQKAVIADLQRDQQQRLTRDVQSQIREAVGVYPLYQANASAREAAEMEAVAALLVDRSQSIADVVARAHARHADMLSAQATAKRDDRAATLVKTQGLPSPGTPALSEVEIPDVTAEDRRTGSWRAKDKRMLGDLIRRGPR